MPKLNSMRVLGVFCTALFISVTLLTFIKGQVNNIEDSVLRLHIVANSDSDIDQQLKLKVRDEVIDRCGFLFEKCETAEQSAKIAINNIGFIKYVAKDVIIESGFDYDVDCDVSLSNFPTKHYERINSDTISLPSGDYNALNIRIGSAVGQNWWCVMYPPLCFVDGVVKMSDEAETRLKAELSDSEYRLITQTNEPSIKIKFKIAEILGNI